MPSVLQYVPGKKANEIVIVANHTSGKFTTEQIEKLNNLCSPLGVNIKFNILKSRCTIKFDTPTIQERFLIGFSEKLKELS